jgi:putative ABC transport system permease protein
MNATPRRPPHRFFRALLALFPFEFRADFGPEMEITFEDQDRDAVLQGGRLGRLRLWGRTLAGVLRTAPREHLDMLRQDAGFTVRVMRRSPGFALTAIVTLALGIGATTAVFSLVSAVLLRPLPYRDAGRLMMLRNTAPRTAVSWSVSYADFRDWKRDSRSFEDMEAFHLAQFNLTGAGEAMRIAGMHASPGLLPLLGIRPALGRALLPSDEAAGGHASVVLTHGLWLRRFGGARDVVGRSIAMNGVAFTIVGVLPPSFIFPIRVDVVASMNLDSPMIERGNHAFEVLAHLRSDVSLDQARREMETIGRRLADAYPGENRGWGVTVLGFQEMLVRSTRPALLLLLAAASFVLLIACSNLGILLLARASARSGEVGIRMALGASRLRILRQLLTESLLIGLVAGALGVGLAVALLRVASGSLPPFVAAVTRIGLDLRVLAFAVAVSVATGIVFGLAPAVRVSRTSLVVALGDASKVRGGRGRARLRGALVASEVGLALMLLVGSGLLLRSLGNLVRVDPGMRTENVLAVEMGLPPARYSEPERVRAFFRDLQAFVSALPGVDAAGLVNQIPMTGFNSQRSFVIEGRPLPPTGKRESNLVGFRTASAGYFTAAAIPLRSGRLFADGDDTRDPPVIVINETMARRWWPGGDPIGRRIALETAPDAFSPWMTVVGVVGDLRHLGLRADPQPELFLPLGGNDTGRSFLVVHSTAPPSTLVPALRRAVAAIDPEMPLGIVQGMADLVEEESIGPARVTSSLLLASGVLALVLAMIGLYGLVSYMVSQRLHEIGLRMALGASRRDVLRLIVGRGLRLTAAGTIIGLAGAWGVSRVLATQLFGVSPTDPAAFAGAATVVGLVALAASYGPARRAARIDPMTALRRE